MYQAVRNFCHFIVLHIVSCTTFPHCQTGARDFLLTLTCSVLENNNATDYAIPFCAIAWNNADRYWIYIAYYFSTVLWHTHSTILCSAFIAAWVAETMVNLELNNSSRKGWEPLNYQARGVGNDWNLHKHFLPCQLRSPFGRLPMHMVARDWEFIVFNNNDDWFSLVGHLWIYFWKMKYDLKI